MSLSETGGSRNNDELSDSAKLEWNERIHGVKNDSKQRLLDFAVELGLIDLVTFGGLTDDFERRKLLLLFAKFMGNRLEYCSVQKDKEPIVTLIEMLLPCGLHNNMRIPAHLVTNLVRRCVVLQ